VPVVVLDTRRASRRRWSRRSWTGIWQASLAGGAAMLGHWRPLFMGFRTRRKIVATTGGAFLGVAPDRRRDRVRGFWILVFVTFRYASLASIVGGLTLPVDAVLLGYPWPVIAFAGAAAAGDRRVAPLEHPSAARRDGEPRVVAPRYCSSGAIVRPRCVSPFQ
jgi:glycerol-3-phosphate acyltransferase PlsY